MVVPISTAVDWSFSGDGVTQTSIIADIAREHDDSIVSSSPLKERNRSIPKPLFPEDAKISKSSVSKKAE